MKKTFFSVIMVLLLCSPAFSAARGSGAKLLFDLSWNDTDDTVQSKLTRQGFQKLEGQGMWMMGTGIPKGGATYLGTVLSADASVFVKHRKNGIESAMILFSSKMNLLMILSGAEEIGLPEEVQNLLETLKYELGRRYTGSDPKIWERVPYGSAVNDDIWFFPKQRHLVYIAQNSPGAVTITYAYVEKSYKYYYLFGGGLVFAVAMFLYFKYSAGEDSD